MLPKEVMISCLEKARTASLFGKKIMEMSREELIACLVVTCLLCNDQTKEGAAGGKSDAG